MQFNQTKQSYLIKQTGHLAPMGQMEQEVFSPKTNEVEWLRETISGLGGTPTGKQSDLWKQLVSLASYPTSNYLNENKKTWYKNNS